MPVIEVGSEEQFREIKATVDRVIIKFHLASCGPCKMVIKPLEEIANELEDIVILSIDVEKHERIASEYSVRGVPSFIGLARGIPTLSRIGAGSPSQLREIFQTFQEAPLPELSQDVGEKDCCIDPD